MNSLNTPNHRVGALICPQLCQATDHAYLAPRNAYFFEVATVKPPGSSPGGPLEALRGLVDHALLLEVLLAILTLAAHTRKLVGMGDPFAQLFRVSWSVDQWLAQMDVGWYVFFLQDLETSPARLWWYSWKIASKRTEKERTSIKLQLNYVKLL